VCGIGRWGDEGVGALRELNLVADLVLILPPERTSGEASAISLDLGSPRNLERETYRVGTRIDNYHPCCFLFFVFSIFFSFFFPFFFLDAQQEQIVFARR